MFYSVFKTLIGSELTVELKNGMSVAGKLTAIDKYLNMDLDEITVQDIEQWPQMYCLSKVFIRGSHISYIQLPAEKINTELLHDTTRVHLSTYDAGGRGRFGNGIYRDNVRRNGVVKFGMNGVAAGLNGEAALNGHIAAGLNGDVAAGLNGEVAGVLNGSVAAAVNPNGADAVGSNDDVMIRMNGNATHDELHAFVNARSID